MNKLICMGECLVDMLPEERELSLSAKAEEHELSFNAKAGGAPANVCACVAKLGAPAYYLGKMSNDMFGKFLFEKLVKCGVKTDYITKTSYAKTALAFVTHGENGEREFSFYRDMTADMMLNPNEIDGELFENGDILHFCSVALMPSPTKDAHKKAILEAIKRGALISFDVNVRLPLWNNANNLKSAIDEFLPYADILKVSDDELEFLCAKNSEKRESGENCGKNEKCEGGKKCTDIEKHESGKMCESTAIRTLFARNDRLKLVFVTKGKDGVSAYSSDERSCFVPAHKVKAIDTTGAGDCFIGCVLYKILSSPNIVNKNNPNNTDNSSSNCINKKTSNITDAHNLNSACDKNEINSKNVGAIKFDFDSIKDALEFASRGASVVVTKMGAMEAMPTKAEINLI